MGQSTPETTVLWTLNHKVQSGAWDRKCCGCPAHMPSPTTSISSAAPLPLEHSLQPKTREVKSTHSPPAPLRWDNCEESTLHRLPHSPPDSSTGHPQWELAVSTTSSSSLYFSTPDLPPNKLLALKSLSAACF